VISGTDRGYCLQHVQPDSRANVVSSPMRTGVRTQEVGWPGHSSYVHLGSRLGMCETVTAFLCISSWHDVN
jgi:hypothetical protein